MSMTETTFAERTERIYAVDDAPPALETIRLAMKLAFSIGAIGLAMPSRIVLDANGGIVLDDPASDGEYVSYRVADGTIEKCVFEGGKLKQRVTIQR